MANSPEFKYNTTLATTAIEMVRKWLMISWQKNFGTDDALQTEVVRNTDDLRTYAEQTNTSKIAYPFSMLLLTNIGPDPDKGAFSRKNIPIVTGRSENSDSVTISNVVPVRIGLGLTVRTDNLGHVLNLAHILIFSAPKVQLNLRNDAGFVFQCSLNIDPELTIPSADLSFPSKEYRFDTTLYINTYLLREKVQGVIRKIKFEMVDYRGTTELGEFDTLDTLVSRELNYTEIVDTASTRYHSS